MFEDEEEWNLEEADVEDEGIINAFGSAEAALAAVDMAQSGETMKGIAEQLEMSPRKLSGIIAKLKMEQGILLDYRNLQSLQLTRLQAQILNAITPTKIAEAPLDVLVRAFKILKDKELVVEGKPSEIKGLVGYLIELEKRENEPIDITAQGPELVSLEGDEDEISGDAAPGNDLPNL